MMKKIILLSLVSFVALSGCANSTKEEATIKKQERQIETLKHEKKELEMLLKNEKEKKIEPAISTEETVSPEAENEIFENLFHSFIKAEFARDEGKLKELTTAKLYTILVDKAGEKDSSFKVTNTVKSSKLYQVEQVNDNEVNIVGRIQIETKVGDYAPNRYEQLVECVALKDSSGNYQIDSQTLTNLA
ncbi:hypothetical protein PSN82_001201 [Enterococcus faecalis]|uniref:hypothetical protein n=1 Tax=Enterococcus faecalis TaxID=1351 RepID=UPI0004594D5A|nr:hypothetical protein [Enterococcus faecalis]EJG4482752.1 hypothetical protein [Enterococcus faecalis]EKL7557598.1 hypothetical protein [Enterococcus faecalis]KAJ64878.1 hypothetical protein P787_1882 [Enterococcus faecalis MN16]